MRNVMRDSRDLTLVFLLSYGGPKVSPIISSASHTHPSIVLESQPAGGQSL
jgi:hypothetical protein